MQSMLGGGGPQEDMFAKLDQMKEIITEVNTQFKDPVSLPQASLSCLSWTGSGDGHDSRESC